MFYSDCFYFSQRTGLHLTGDSKTDADIIAFMKARQNLLQNKGIPIYKKVFSAPALQLTELFHDFTIETFLDFPSKRFLVPMFCAHTVLEIRKLYVYLREPRIPVFSANNRS